MITVETAGESRLATATSLKAILTSLSDAAANTLIDQASALIASRAGRVLHSEVVSQTWRDANTAALCPARWPVSSIAAVTVDGAALEATDYEDDGNRIFRLASDARTRWGGSKIIVQYTGGYAPIPADLQRACLDLCVNLHETEGRDQTLRSENVPGVLSQSFRDPGKGGGIVPDHVQGVIDCYREVRL